MLPSSNILVLIIVSLGLSRLRSAVLHLGISLSELMFSAEMASTRLFAGKGIVAKDFCKIDEVSHATGFFEFGVETIS